VHVCVCLSVQVLQFVDKLDFDETEATAPSVRERSKRRRRGASRSGRRQRRRLRKSQSRRRKSGRRSKLRGRVRRAYYGNGKKFALI